jgi:hypothetical protein
MMGEAAFAARVRVEPAAFGPCLHVAGRTSPWEARRDAGEVVEDIALAQRYREHGLPVVCAAGGRSIAFRMYPDGFAQLREGWTKNLAAGAGRVRMAPMLLAVVTVASAAAVGGGVVVHSIGQRGPLFWWAVAYAIVAAGAFAALRRIGRFRWWTWAMYPVPLAFFIALFLRSLWVTTVRREVVWRGRTIRLDAGAVADREVTR